LDATSTEGLNSARRRILLALVGGFAASGASAQSGAGRPLKLILTAPPGSSIDVLGRLIGDGLRERLGVPVIAENRPAAGGTAGTEAIARAEPDGTTIGLSFTGPLVLAPFLYRSLPYDPTRDLAPIVLVGTAPNLLAVNSGVPARNVAEFVAHVRANPGRLNYASVGNGSSSHLAMELLKTQGDLYLVHIPYNGAPPAAQAVAAGDVDVIVSNPTSLLPLVKAGKLRALAVTSRTRWSGMPELPTLAESGFPGFEAIAWNGFVAPAATPATVIERLNREINAVLQNPATRQKMEAAGWEPAGGSAQQFAQFMRDERTRWAPVVKRSGARLD
jgi:tripartite-type tricarboxylate transporter receptor subunit TctC